MKKTGKYSIITIFIAAATFFTGCSDDFLKEKKNYGNFTSDIIYNDYQGAKDRVNYLYQVLLPSSTAGITSFQSSSGASDELSKSTEEYGGFSAFVDPTINKDNTSNKDWDWFYVIQKNTSPWGRIRECNDVIAGVEGSTELSETQKNLLAGQAYFFRAWCYYMLVKVYGGVPIIDFVQDAMLGSSGGAELVIPRSKTIDCVNFICSDLTKASKMLPLNWDNIITEAGPEGLGDNYGRVTAGTALALRGKVRLLYASPLFNRDDDPLRWDLAYESNKNALDTLQLGGFGLAYANNPGTNASNWAKMFSDYQSPEAVFVTLYNNVKTGTGTNYDKNNGWENSIRPKNTGGGGGKSTTAQMLDLFPMADGKKPGTSTYAYDPQLFFMNRDPRFYRTFAFPGVRWAFKGDPTSKGTSFRSGADYILWSYVWYKNATEQDADDQTGYAADGLGTSNTSVFIRKRTDDLDVNSSPQYIFDTNESSMFRWSGAPYMEMRYAEVLLNFAEAACGANHGAEALEALRQIRRRVGYTGDCGLDESLTSNRDKLFAAILYERQIELAYEGKRFDDVRRWMLWDGGTGLVEGAPANWTLTGFGGNTCTYLGVSQLNGTRRTGIEIQLAASLGQSEEKETEYNADGSVKTAYDPILVNNVTRPNGLDLMEDFATATTKIDALKAFYETNFKRKTTRVDGDLINTMNFRPKYYFVGFHTSAQKTNSTLLQTIGWADSQHGGMGTFDPLAE